MSVQAAISAILPRVAVFRRCGYTASQPVPAIGSFRAAIAAGITTQRRAESAVPIGMHQHLSARREESLNLLEVGSPLVIWKTINKHTPISLFQNSIVQQGQQPAIMQ